jgi:hypothetical protein
MDLISSSVLRLVDPDTIISQVGRVTNGGPRNLKWDRRRLDGRDLQGHSLQDGAKKRMLIQTEGVCLLAYSNLLW